MAPVCPNFLKFNASLPSAYGKYTRVGEILTDVCVSWQLLGGLFVLWVLQRN